MFVITVVLIFVVSFLTSYTMNRIMKKEETPQTVTFTNLTLGFDFVGHYTKQSLFKELELNNIGYVMDTDTNVLIWTSKLDHQCSVNLEQFN